MRVLTMLLPSILTCKQYAVGSGGVVEIQYAKGGVPVILVPDDSLAGSGFCGRELATGASELGTQAGDANAAPKHVSSLFATSLALLAGAFMSIAGLAAL